MRKLYLVWGFLDLCLLAAGVLCVTVSVLYMSSKDRLILDLILQRIDFKLGVLLGSSYILATLLSVPSILQPKDRPVLLKVLNILLICLSIFTLAVGTVFWLFSLRQLDTFSQIWKAQSADMQAAIQDKFSCCGYWNGTTAGLYGAVQGFCADMRSAAIAPGCQSAITSAKSPGSDFTLENVFSSIYGFEAIIIMFFLATVCVIKEREVGVRFARIDEKRGGGGFV